MNTSHLGRTTLATSAVAATLILVTAGGAPTASAQIPAPVLVHRVPSAAGAAGAVDDIGVMVAMRKEAAARYYVQHAGEITRAQSLDRRVAELSELESAVRPWWRR
jgi:hypothetical protein